MTFQTNAAVARLVAILSCLLLALTYTAWQSPFALALQPCGDSVTAEAGDTLAQIAIRCAVPIPALLEANPDLDNRNVLAEGQVIALSAAEPAERDAADASQSSDPVIDIEPTSGPPGAVLEITASGFSAESEVTVGLGPAESEPLVEIEATTDADGGLSTQLEVPGDAEAEQRFVVAIQATDSDGPSASSSEFIVTSEAQGPAVTLSRTQGPAGTLVRLRSEGFAERLPIEVGFGPVDSEYDLIVQARTNGRGRFNQQFQVPTGAMPGQEYVFVIVPSDTQAEVVSDVFTVAEGGQAAEPQVSVLPSSVPAGANVQLYASGFPANTRVSYGIGEPASDVFDLASARTNASGSLRATVRVPESVSPETELVALVYVPQQEARATSDAFTVARQEGDEGALFVSTNLYLIALGDAGQSGQEVGCQDSVIPVEVEIEPTAAPLTAALETLLGLDERFFGETGLYNALHRTELAVDSVDIADGVATIDLTGDFPIGGVCDGPRVQAQLEETALQYDSVDEVQIFVNGAPLARLLSEES